MEAWKSFLNAGQRPPLWFWRTARGEELDLLVEIGPQRFLSLECKAAAVDRRNLKGFRALEGVYGPAARHPTPHRPGTGAAGVV